MLLHTLLLSMMLLLLRPLESSSTYQVHLVPHSHDDVGWLKTPPQYYYGWNNSIQHANVKLTYDSVFASLSESLGNGAGLAANRTFTVVEIAFFSRWFHEQDPTVRGLVRKMVSLGMIEFSTGGWVSHDEATALYIDMLDQVSLGLEFIRSTFGTMCFPRTQWQVDPFGHTAGQVMLFGNEAGNMDALYFSRMDYRDFTKRQISQDREFFWIPSPSLGKKSFVFTSMMLHGSYCPPVTFNFDILLSEPNVVVQECSHDDGRDEWGTAAACSDLENTASEWGDTIASMVQSDVLLTRGGDVMWTMGCDFTYMQAATWFQNMERIHQLALAKGNTTTTGPLWTTDFVYSTPHRYAESKVAHSAAGEFELGVKRYGDFVPYADGPHAFWTGFYGSRPSFKRFIRATSGWYQSARQIAAAFPAFYHTDALKGLRDPLQVLAEAVAEMQHHDAVTGTAKQHVTNHYIQKLNAAIINVTNSLSRALTSTSNVTLPLDPCLRAANESICPPTTVAADAPFYILGWNGISDGGKGSDRVAFEVPILSTTAAGIEMEYAWEVSPASASLQCHVMRGVAVDGFKSPSHDITRHVANVVVSHVPPMSPFVVKAVPFLRKKAARVPHPFDAVGVEGDIPNDDVTVVETATIQLKFSATTGKLLGVWNKTSGIARNMTLVVCYYRASTGDNFSSQSAGAYIFRPVVDADLEDNPSAACVPVWSNSTGAPLRVVYQDPSSASLIVVEQNITSWMTLRWMVLHGGDALHLEYVIYELPTDDATPPDFGGKELVLRWAVEGANNTRLWTDSNGLELMERNRNESFDEGEPIASLYFPVVSAAVLRDEESEWSVAVDRPVGCASVGNGELECVVHRRLLVDDNRGVGEPLNETADISPYVGCDWTPCGRHSGPAMSVQGRWGLSLTRPSSLGWRVAAERQYRSQPFTLVGSGALNDTVERSWLALGSWSGNATTPMWSVASLPHGVTLASLQRVAAPMGAFPTQLWVRLAHMDSCFDFASCSSKVASVELLNLFPALGSVTRTTLTSPAVLWRPRNESSHWNTAFRAAVEKIKTPENEGMINISSLERPVGGLWNTTAVMYPMEVHAYLIDLPHL